VQEQKPLYVMVDPNVRQMAEHLAYYHGYGTLTAVVVTAVRKLYEAEETESGHGTQESQEAP